ncbi:MAG: PEP-CTERM sorting domain-containing protein [Candidatus Omnitrophica bacterium]|nr:PEP-CTERM sorting domain-containing protein [Candidatus Omnitrophota bacterium]
MNWNRIFIIAVLVLTLPISQAYSAVAEWGIVLGENPWADAGLPTIASQGDLPPFDIGISDPLPGMDLIESGAGELLDELEELALYIEGEDAIQNISVAGTAFWSKRKVVITSAVLLLTALLLAILGLAVGGSGSGSGSTSGPGGGPSPNPNNPGPPDNPDPDDFYPPPLIYDPPPPGPDPDPFIIEPGAGKPGGNSGVPHSPEPSTVLLMGFGLLIPFLRRRGL